MSTIEYYNMVASVSTIIAVVMFLLALVMWFKLGMYHYIMVLSGSGARKGAERIRRAAQEGSVQGDAYGNNKAVISWNTTSGGLFKKAASLFETENKDDYLLYSQQLRYLERTMPLESAEEYATRVLEEIKDPEPEPDNKSDFIIEREIISKYYNGKL
ncbi:MAG: hypothetical protein IKZ97_06160 [Butyrivibrio sp.]|nr:hypothetical protein [Butyrivibrio sp.]